MKRIEIITGNQICEKKNKIIVKWRRKKKKKKDNEHLNFILFSWITQSIRICVHPCDVRVSFFTLQSMHLYCYYSLVLLECISTIKYLDRLLFQAIDLFAISWLSIYRPCDHTTFLLMGGLIVALIARTSVTCSMNILLGIMDHTNTKI
jgi:hypothetical protein